MKEQAIKRINTIGRVCNVFAWIAKILVGLALVTVLAGAVICFVLPKEYKDIEFSTQANVLIHDTLTDVDKTSPEAELFHGVTQALVLEGDSEEITLTLRDVAWLILLTALPVAILFVTMIFVGRLCRAFRDCHSPFEENVIQKMQHFAYALIPWALVSSVASSVTETLTSNKPSFIFSADLGVVLVVLVVLMLVYIFKYGAVLQQESDETL